jgi:hypothetical protein
MWPKKRPHRIESPDQTSCLKYGIWDKVSSKRIWKKIFAPYCTTNLEKPQAAGIRDVDIAINLIFHAYFFLVFYDRL